jgi:rhodanese-related sulfurtransferase
MTMPGGIPSVSPTEASKAAQEGALIVDVRERDEFAAERVDGVRLLPTSEFVAGHESLPKDRPLLVICAAGSRSQAATGYLIQRGWTDVRNVAGGMNAWRAAGLPVQTGPPQPGEGELEV